MATPEKKNKKFPQRVVIAWGYVRKIRGPRGSVITIDLPDLEFNICQGCNHWVNPARALTRCTCCNSGHNVPKVEATTV